MKTRDPFPPITRLISGKFAIPSLANALREAGAAVYGSADAERKAPTPTDLKKRLEAIYEAARVLQRELHDEHIVSWLAVAKPETMENWGLAVMLGDVEERAFVAAETANALKRKGAGRTAAVPEGLGARDLCALIVYKAWTAAHPEPPGVIKQGALDACDYYWRACGQPAFGNSKAGWREYLTTARLIATEPQTGRRAAANILVDGLLLAFKIAFKKEMEEKKGGEVKSAG